MPSKIGSRIKPKAVPKKISLDLGFIRWKNHFQLSRLVLSRLTFSHHIRWANDHTKWMKFSNSHVCKPHCHLCEVKYPTKIQSRYSKQISLCGILYNCKEKKCVSTKEMQIMQRKKYPLRLCLVRQSNLYKTH